MNQCMKIYSEKNNTRTNVWVCVHAQDCVIHAISMRSFADFELFLCHQRLSGDPQAYYAIRKLRRLPTKMLHSDDGYVLVGVRTGRIMALCFE